VHPARVNRRTALVIAACATTLAVGGVLLVPALTADRPAPAAASTPVSTAPVTAGDMVSETKAPGAIAYAVTTPVAAGLGGVLTELPDPGASLSPGSVLYRVDTRPVILLSGTVPAWRDFASGMDDGTDVQQLEQNLAAFGFFTDEPDAEFDWDTAVAIRDWQSSLGLERTGTLERGSVLFWNGSLRVDAITARVGQDVAPGSALYQTTSTEKVVDVAVKSSDRALAVVGQAVSVTLPDGSSVDGIIQMVGAPLSKSDSDGGPSSIVIPVRIGITDQAVIADLALANVTVSFSSALRSDVLTVPVDALVPLDDSHYAVELPPTAGSTGRELVPVTTGAVASGRVEISGDRIVAGLLVVVPAR